MTFFFTVHLPWYSVKHLQRLAMAKLEMAFEFYLLIFFSSNLNKQMFIKINFFLLSQAFKWVTLDVWTFISNKHDGVIFIILKVIYSLCSYDIICKTKCLMSLFSLFLGYFQESGASLWLLKSWNLLVIRRFPDQLLVFSCSSSLSFSSHFLNSLPTLCVSNLREGATQ